MAEVEDPTRLNYIIYYISQYQHVPTLLDDLETLEIEQFYYDPGTILLPSDLPSGEYTLRLSTYDKSDPETMLQTQCPDDNVLLCDDIVLQPFTIR